MNKFIKFGIGIFILCIVFVTIVAFTPNVPTDGVIYWDGNGSGNLPCEYGALWILAPAQDVTSAVLTVNGSDYDMVKFGNNWKASSVGYLDNPVDAYVTYTGDAPDAHLQLSHCEDGSPTNTPTFTLTPTETSTSTATPTDPPTETPTNTPTDTPTRTPTYVTDTPTVTPTGTQPTYTPTTTETKTATPTYTPTETETSTPTITYTPTKTQTVFPTTTLTATPKPPQPAYALADGEYTNDYSLGTAVIDGRYFILYKGISDANGTLLLPSTVYGASVYQNTIWVHRLWKSGWLYLNIDSVVVVNNKEYVVTKVTYLPYGVYPEGNDLKIATCYSDESGWVGVAVYNLEASK